jgi:hypothetical protein
VQLLDAPHLQEHECYFAANNIKAACQKHQVRSSTSCAAALHLQQLFLQVV